MKHATSIVIDNKQTWTGKKTEEKTVIIIIVIIIIGECKFEKVTSVLAAATTVEQKRRHSLVG